MREPRNGATISTGASSILVIFVLLCLTTFSVLSLLSANADMRLSQKARAASDEYWSASNKAEHILMLADKALAQAYTSAGGASDYAEKGFAALSAAAQAEGITLAFEMGSDNVVRFAVPVGEAQELDVALALDYSPRLFRKTAWQLRSTVEWETMEDTLNLWDGEDFVVAAP